MAVPALQRKELDVRQVEGSGTLLEECLLGAFTDKHESDFVFSPQEGRRVDNSREVLGPRHRSSVCDDELVRPSELLAHLGDERWKRGAPIGNKIDALGRDALRDDMLTVTLPDHRDLVHGRIEATLQPFHRRSEEHTSELQSRQYLVCRLLLEKKKI